MKSQVLILPILIGGLVFTKGAAVAPEQEFWKWFQAHEAMLFDLEKNREAVFDQLAAEMHKVNPDLTFEFGPRDQNCREFIISADGIKEAFPKVEALFAAAPSLPRWKFIKFRPRRKPFDISYAGITVKAKSVLVRLSRAGQKANVTVYLPDYKQNADDKYMTITFLLLDQALGEYDVEMYVGKIDIKSLSDAPKDACSLSALPKAFDNALSKQ